MPPLWLWPDAPYFSSSPFPTPAGETPADPPTDPEPSSTDEEPAKETADEDGLMG